LDDDAAGGGGGGGGGAVSVMCGACHSRLGSAD